MFISKYNLKVIKTEVNKYMKNKVISDKHHIKVMLFDDIFYKLLHLPEDHFSKKFDPKKVKAEIDPHIHPIDRFVSYGINRYVKKILPEFYRELVPNKKDINNKNNKKSYAKKIKVTEDREVKKYKTKPTIKEISFSDAGVKDIYIDHNNNTKCIRRKRNKKVKLQPLLPLHKANKGYYVWLKKNKIEDSNESYQMYLEYMVGDREIAKKYIQENTRICK